MKGQRVSAISFVLSIGNVISNIFRLLMEHIFSSFDFKKRFGVRNGFYISFSSFNFKKRFGVRNGET